MCAEYARCDVERFRELSWESRLRYRLYAERQGERDQMRQRKREDEAEREERRAAPRPAGSRAPGGGRHR